MGPEWLVRLIGDWWATTPPEVLEPSPGTSQCAYELLRAFDRYARARKLRYTLGAGTLLGAMRNHPGGLLQWEHDVDIYMPARDAWHAMELLQLDCARETLWTRRSCGVILSHGLTDRHGKACCGWGFKLYHRHSDACELDVLVLAAARAPFMHGETPFWPLWGLPFASVYQRLALMAQQLRSKLLGNTGPDGTYFVIPEDVRHKCMLGNASNWCSLAKLHADPKEAVGAEWAWCGTPLSFFQDEYFAPGELFPFIRGRFHNLRLPVPQQPWALLHRAYGRDVAHVARLNEHGGARADLRLAANQHLLSPARVRHLSWWQ